MLAIVAARGLPAQPPIDAACKTRQHIVAPLTSSAVVQHPLARNGTASSWHAADSFALHYFRTAWHVQLCTLTVCTHMELCHDWRCCVPTLQGVQLVEAGDAIVFDVPNDVGRPSGELSST